MIAFFLAAALLPPFPTNAFTLSNPVHRIEWVSNSWQFQYQWDTNQEGLIMLHVNPDGSAWTQTASSLVCAVIQQVGFNYADLGAGNHSFTFSRVYSHGLITPWFATNVTIEPVARHVDMFTNLPVGVLAFYQSTLPAWKTNAVWTNSLTITNANTNGGTVSFTNFGNRMFYKVGTN